MATSNMLFACTNCHKRFKFEDLSSSQQLCKTCRKEFPLVTCTYCRLEFHPVKNSGSRDTRPACEHCSRDFKQYGTPSFCSTCNLQSAFTGKQCSRCSHSEKKYGSPVACEHCKLVCAFPKSEDARKKTDGKVLCLLCTINYKKALFKKKAQLEKQQQHGKGRASSKYPSKPKEDGPKAKRAKLDRPDGPDSVPAFAAVPSSFTLVSTVGRDPQPLDLLSSNHLLETDKLQNEIASLKKQLAQRDQALLEKDKMICSLRAESLEKDKEFRQKQVALQKSHADAIESLQVNFFQRERKREKEAEVRTLKRQVSMASHKPKGSSAAVIGSSGIGSSMTSLSSSSSS